MSVLDRFEKSAEGAVNGVFAKFGSKDLQPVDLSSALEREIDAEAMPVYRNRERDARRFGTYTRQQRDGVCYQHLSSVYLAARVRVPEGATWSHAVGVEALVEREGGM